MIEKIDAKYIANKLGVPLRTAQQYYTDIKIHFKLNAIVTKFHLFSYLKIYTDEELKEKLLETT